MLQQLIKRIDKLTVYLVCTALGLVFSAAIYFVGYNNITAYLILIAVRALFTSGALVLYPLFTADCAEYGQFITGDRAQGVAFSVQTFTTKMITALSASVGMFVLGLVGFVSGEGVAQLPETIDWIWRLNTIAPVFSGVVGFFHHSVCV